MMIFSLRATGQGNLCKLVLSTQAFALDSFYPIERYLPFPCIPLQNTMLNECASAIAQM